MEQVKNRGLALFIWRSIGSVRVAVFILTLLAVDLSIAYFSINGRSIIFEPMNQVGVRTWLNTYAMANLRYTAWFFIFLILLSGLVINTLACSTDRLRLLIRARLQQQANKRFYSALSTHVMHLGMVVILIGYLVSYTMSQVYPGLILAPQKEIIVAGTNIRVKLTAMNLPLYQGKRSATFNDRVIVPTVQLRVVTPTAERTASLGFNSPVRFQGYTFFLQRFSPNKKNGMSSDHYIVIDVRRDPGVLLYFIGISIFSGGLFSYMIFWIRSRQPGKLTT